MIFINFVSFPQKTPKNERKLFRNFSENGQLLSEVTLETQDPMGVSDKLYRDTTKTIRPPRPPPPQN